MNGKQLKNSILQWAIQGKLVPQDASDEPAIELLKRFNQKIKPITEDVPFEIPESWAWVKFGNVCKIVRGGSPRPISSYLTNSADSYNWIKIGDTEKGGKYINSTKQKIKKEGLTKTRLVHKGDFLLTNSMSFGRPYILNIDGCIHDGWLAISDYEKIFIVDYLYHLLSSSFAYSQFCNAASGGVVQNLNIEKVCDALLPLPPFAEQKRIVAKIEELLPLVERYTKAQEGLDKLNAGIKVKLRASILQEAIQGHLVPQDASEEPAIELLKRLNPKIKPITDDVPFEVPESWVWVKGKQLFLPMESIKPQGNFIYIDVDAVNNRKHCIDKPKFLSKEKAPSRATRKLHCNDVLFSMVRPYLKNIALITEEFKDAIASTGFYVITPSFALLPKYLYYLMLSDYVVCGLNSFMKGDNSPSINNEHIEDFLFPLPPLAEQHRIVERLESLFSTLDTIETNLN